MAHPNVWKADTDIPRRSGCQQPRNLGRRPPSRRICISRPASWRWRCRTPRSHSATAFVVIEYLEDCSRVTMLRDGGSTSASSILLSKILWSFVTKWPPPYFPAK